MDLKLGSKDPTLYAQWSQIPPAIPPPLLESYGQRCHIPGVSLREEDFEVLILKQYIIV